MVKVKKLVLFFLTSTLLICTFLCFSTTASAVAAGNINNKSKMTVITGENYSMYPGNGPSFIILKQKKGKFTYNKDCKKKTAKMYAVFKIKYKNCKTGKTKTTWLKKGSKKIKLDKKNVTYKFTISCDETKMHIRKSHKKDFSWKTTPQWWVGGFWKVYSYY